MKHIGINDIIQYTQISSNRSEIYGRNLCKPYFRLSSSQSDDFVEKWIVAASIACKAGDKNAKHILLRLENNEVLYENDYLMLDSYIADC